jgi:hypothetical protein
MKQSIKNNKLIIEIKIDPEKHCLYFNHKNKSYSLHHLIYLPYKSSHQIGNCIVPKLKTSVVMKLQNLSVVTGLEDL